MKPCSRNRKLLAWLALGELDARRAGELRAHIQTCDGCRRYLEQISTVTEKLTAAEVMPEIEASESFHQRLAGRLEEPGSFWESLVAQFAPRRLNWRVALPVLGTAALVVATLSILLRQPTISPPVPIRVQAVLPSVQTSDLPPTIANYQRVANRSLDELDELLTRQANRNPPPAQIYTASMFALGNAVD
jgi:anti-sigma factor RsiW